MVGWVQEVTRAKTDWSATWASSHQLGHLRAAVRGLRCVWTPPGPACATHNQSLTPLHRTPAVYSSHILPLQGTSRGQHREKGCQLQAYAAQKRAPYAATSPSQPAGGRYGPCCTEPQVRATTVHMSCSRIVMPTRTTTSQRNNSGAGQSLGGRQLKRRVGAPPQPHQSPLLCRRKGRTGCT